MASAVLETSVGELVVDLLVAEAPRASENFLKLCAAQYYDGCIFHNVQRDFLVQSGDPTASGRGGECIWSLRARASAAAAAASSSGGRRQRRSRFFAREISPTLTHARKGAVGFTSNRAGLCGSQFYITCAPALHELDERCTVFGHVVAGFETLAKINAILTDRDGRPKEAVRILRATPRDDPFPDEPAAAPLAAAAAAAAPLAAPEDILTEEEVAAAVGVSERDVRALEREQEAKEARSRAGVLSMIGDLPSEDAAPPDTVLFVCKLHQATRGDDLVLIFSRFGEVRSCEVVTDWKTGDSLQYAFVEFATHTQAEEAYKKMQNVIIDDRRIHVDFSQSVSKLVKGPNGRTRRVLKNAVPAAAPPSRTKRPAAAAATAAAPEPPCKRPSTANSPQHRRRHHKHHHHHRTRD